MDLISNYNIDKMNRLVPSLLLLSLSLLFVATAAWNLPILKRDAQAPFKDMKFVNNQ